MTAVAALITLSVYVIGACGDGSGPGPNSGLERSAPLGTLDSNEAGILCDWYNAKQGGYGRSETCPEGAQMTEPSKASCTSGIQLAGTLCSTLTVGDIEDCTNAIGTDLCAYYATPGCENLRACLN